VATSLRLKASKYSCRIATSLSPGLITGANTNYPCGAWGWMLLAGVEHGRRVGLSLASVILQTRCLYFAKSLRPRSRLAAGCRRFHRIQRSGAIEEYEDVDSLRLPDGPQMPPPLFELDPAALDLAACFEPS
jgi:hypothetical protein